jgi:hypothetical protein
MNTTKTQYTIKRDEIKFSYSAICDLPQTHNKKKFDKGKRILSGTASSVNQQFGLRNGHFVSHKIYLTYH